MTDLYRKDPSIKEVLIRTGVETSTYKTEDFSHCGKEGATTSVSPLTTYQLISTLNDCIIWIESAKVGINRCIDKLNKLMEGKCI